jgi:hypothetical protein
MNDVFLAHIMYDACIGSSRRVEIFSKYALIWGACNSKMSFL